jgi:hypothetical protein
MWWKNHALFLSYRSIILWYSPLMLYLGWLGACLHHVMTTNQSPQASMIIWFWLVISLYALVNNVLSLCMIMVVIAFLVGRAQSFAKPSPVLSMSSTRASNSQKPKLFQRFHYKFLCMAFQTIPSKFSCATFQNLQNTSHFVTLFLAYEDVVVGFAIFHIELSTPLLACFICSSLILQESWSDHCNL